MCMPTIFGAGNPVSLLAVVQPVFWAFHSEKKDFPRLERTYPIIIGKRISIKRWELKRLWLSHPAVESRE